MSGLTQNNKHYTKSNGKLSNHDDNRIFRPFSLRHCMYVLKFSDVVSILVVSVIVSFSFFDKILSWWVATECK